MAAAILNPSALFAPEVLESAPVGELECAAAIQQLLLQTALPPVPGLGLAAWCQSARQIGGDFFEVRQDSQGKVWMTIADVMGKGVPAALFATTLSPLLRSLARQCSTPADLLTHLNDVLVDELSRVDMFITAQVVLADLPNRQLRIAGAGHCPLLLASSAGAIESVWAEDLPLGLEAGTVFHESCVPLKPGSRVLLYTDGVTEALGPSGDRFGPDRLAGSLVEAVEKNFTAFELKQHLITQLELFQGGTAAVDDQTFIIFSDEAQRLAQV